MIFSNIWVRNMTSSLGFVIVIKRSRRDSDGDPSEVVFQCDCGGMYRSNKTSGKHAGTKNKLSIWLDTNEFG